MYSRFKDNDQLTSLLHFRMTWLRLRITTQIGERLSVLLFFEKEVYTSKDVRFAFEELIIAIIPTI
jgi:hypothetical protein